MNSDVLQEAKQRLRIPELWRLLGLPGEPAKSCRVPWREDKNPSGSVYDDGLRFHDFGTGEDFDAIDFLAKARGLSLADTIAEFKKLAGVTDSPPPAPRPQPSTINSQPPFDWQTCVAALTPEHRLKLADWRGYAPKFVDWLHAQNLIGLFDGERIAFAVHDARGNVIGCHYRRKEDESWRYHPTGTQTRPLVIGDVATAKTVFASESQWDALAVLDCLHAHIQPLADTAAVITRGASNGRLLAGLCAPDAIVCAFGQNDDAGAKWLAAVAAHCGCKCVHAVTPQPHKDANDWTRAGVIAADIQKAIAEAQPVTVSTAPDLHAAPPRRVSNPVTLPPEDEADAADAPQNFPVESLPPIMASFVAAVSRCERVPVALPAVCALGVASAAIGAGLETVSGPNRVTRGNLFLLASAESGSGKSETFRLIAAPLLDHQTQLLEVWRQKTSPQLQSEIRVLDKEIGSLEKKAAKSGDPTERDRMLGELEFKLARKDELARQAAMPCIIAQDVTTERLAVLLRDNREVVFSASADARKLVDNLLGRYNPGKTTDESLYLSAYSGDFVRVDRQGRDAVILNRPCLSLCWFVQPDLLATMLDEQSLSASGFLPRLLLCHTLATPRRIEGEPQSLSEAVRSQWTQLIADLLAAYHSADKPRRIEPTHEASALLNDFHNRIVDRRTADLADVGAFAARYAENAWRLAVVLHAAFYGAQAHAHPLNQEIAANAVRIVEWFADSQLDILAKGRRAAAEKLETEVLELIETNGERKSQDYTTAREVQRERIAPNAEAARALLDRMERDGLLIGEDMRPLHGGKVTRVFRRVRNPVPE